MIDLEAVRRRYSSCRGCQATRQDDCTCSGYRVAMSVGCLDPDVIALCDELERLRGRVAELEAHAIADEAMLEAPTAATPEEAAEPAPWDSLNDPETPEGSRPDIPDGWAALTPWYRVGQLSPNIRVDLQPTDHILLEDGSHWPVRAGQIQPGAWGRVIRRVAPDYHAMIDALPEPVDAVELVTGWGWGNNSATVDIFGAMPQNGLFIGGFDPAGWWLFEGQNSPKIIQDGEGGNVEFARALLRAIADGQIEGIPAERLAVLGGGG